MSTMDAPPGNAPLPDAPATPAPKRKRARTDAIKIDREKIAERVTNFYDSDDQARSMDIENRLQRYAKLRMWTEGKDWPWENASDVGLPDMMTHSLKVQDTLHNAVMSTRPPVISRALKDADKDKQDNVDNLLDFQFFVENKGENFVGESADAFVNDGTVTAFIPWVKEERDIHEMYTLDPIPEAQTPEEYFSKFLTGIYAKNLFKKRDADGWSWEVLSDDKLTWFKVEFYTVGDEIEMDAQKTSIVFNAPRPIVKDYEDVLAPVRCANLQIPSPSNPNGAAHAILVDYPTLDEVKRLKASGYYDMLTDEDIEKLEGVQSSEHLDTTGQQEKIQKDVFEGKTVTLAANEGTGEGESRDHKTLTRLMCFDIYDLDGDGVNEDVIWWVFKESGILAKARELTQVYPANPPRRPFAEGSFIPVRGRRSGISLLEMLEGLHDMIKQFIDQTTDSGTIKNVPFFFYRASSNMRPETIRLWPGEGYPLSDPKNDVSFPQFNNQGDAFGFNLVSMLGQMQERLTNIGDLQLGRVPQGKASALRTVRGMQSVLGQGDARPERILRRYFIFLSEVYAQMHELNQAFLPRDKQILVNGIKKPDEDPYRTIKDPAQIRGRFQFDFTANAMNTSKEALQHALEGLMTAFLSPLPMQMKIVTPEDAYQLLRDYGKAMGQDSDKYLTPPTPDANLPKLFAEEVLSMIFAGNLPDSRPAEDPMEHLKKLVEFAHTPEFGYFTPTMVNVFKAHLAMLRQKMQADAQHQAMVAAAGQAQGAQGQGGVPGPQGTAPLDTTQAPLQANELQDETLPGAGGGANPGPLQ